MAFKVFIDGAEGTTGLKIFERFSARRDIELLTIDPQKRKDLNARCEQVAAADISFLCLPDDAAREVAEAAPKNAKILDTSTAHRVNPNWVYGFPELNQGQREKIKGASRVAVPGCYPTGFISLVAPLVQRGIAAPDYPFTVHALTGFSGGGKKMIAQYEDEGRGAPYYSPRQYGLMLKHKHLPEMKAVAGLVRPPIFNPIVDDYFAGMEVTVPIYPHLLLKPMGPKQVSEVLQEHYEGQKMITVHPYGEGPEDGFLAANALAGKNTLEIFVFGHEEQMILVARFDNLGKGASGAAVQCMNIMLELPEETGLL